MLYLTSDHLPVFVPLGVIGFYRYLWYAIRLLASFAYKPIPVPEKPTYRAEEDVTIIVPTIDADDSFATAARSWLAGNPREIIIVTEEKMKGELEKLAEEVDGPYQDFYSSNEKRLSPSDSKRGRIRVLTVPKANKRLQMAEGIRRTKTDIIVFADDDALWPPTLLPLVLACFEDQQIGGVGTSQVVKSVGSRMTVWEVLAAFRLSIRNIEIAASTHIDGGIPCLSGRTAAYRTIILKDPKFLEGFTQDFWLGKYHLNSGDDKFLTRWMVSHGWNTYVQCRPGAELQSTMKPNWRFLKQVLRWTRNTWRSDLRSIFMERHIWTRHPYTAYTMIDKFLNPLTLLVGPCLVIWLIVKSTRDPAGPNAYHLPSWNIIISYCVWLMLTRGAKLLPHFFRRPQDVIYLPVWVLFGYYFAIMKIYALFTLHEVGWGTRAGVDEPLPGQPSQTSKDDAAAIAILELKRREEQDHLDYLNSFGGPPIASLSATERSDNSYARRRTRNSYSADREEAGSRHERRRSKADDLESARGVAMDSEAGSIRLVPDGDHEYPRHSNNVKEAAPTPAGGVYVSTTSMDRIPDDGTDQPPRPPLPASLVAGGGNMSRLN